MSIIRILRARPDFPPQWISIAFTRRGPGWFISQIIGDDGTEYVLDEGEEVLAWRELANSLSDLVPEVTA